MLKDDFKLVGFIHAVRTNIVTGQVDVFDFPNLVVTSGKTLIAARIVGNAQAAIGWMAVGTGTDDPDPGDTTLGAEIGRVALTTATSAGAVATMVGNFPAGTATGSVGEAGTFNAAAAGNMLSRSTFTPIPKGPNDAIEITWTVTAQ